MRETPADDMNALADEIALHLGEECDKAPYAFFGHSMGAWIAYEVIRRFRRNGTRVPLKLYASGNRSPILYGKEFDSDPVCLGDLDFSDFWQAFERCNWHCLVTFERNQSSGATD